MALIPLQTSEAHLKMSPHFKGAMIHQDYKMGGVAGLPDMVQFSLKSTNQGVSASADPEPGNVGGGRSADWVCRAGQNQSCTAVSGKHPIFHNDVLIYTPGGGSKMLIIGVIAVLAIAGGAYWYSQKK